MMSRPTPDRRQTAWPKIACLAAALLAVLGGGCSTDIHEIGRAPRLAPIGAGMWSDQAEVVAPAPVRDGPSSTGSIWQTSGSDLFRDSRAIREGDVLTVKIKIADRATVDTKSNRSRKSTRDAGVSTDYDVNFPSAHSKGSMDAMLALDGSTQTDGKGKTSRQETIDVRIAAIVTQVLPNGNMIISGSQEVLVNFELRVVTVAGVVRPIDISPDNTIPYERIAEARISYGGRGRIMEVQQPAWGQQIVDIISPM